MKIVYPNDPAYDTDREISNARFDYRPRAIYYCANADDVAWIIREAHGDGVPVRIRAGGHQHEGMCTANGVKLIDLSCINAIEYRDGHVWIGAGAALTDVYAERRRLHQFRRSRHRAGRVLQEEHDAVEQDEAAVGPGQLLSLRDEHSVGVASPGILRRARGRRRARARASAQIRCRAVMNFG